MSIVKIETSLLSRKLYSHQFFFCYHIQAIIGGNTTVKWHAGRTIPISLSQFAIINHWLYKVQYWNESCLKVFRLIKMFAIICTLVSNSLRNFSILMTNQSWIKINCRKKKYCVQNFKCLWTIPNAFGTLVAFVQL